MKQQIDNISASRMHQAQASKLLMTHANKLRKTPLALAIAAAISFSPLTLAAPGDPVGGEFRVNSTTVNNQFDPVVAVDADGDFVVAWPTTSPPSGVVTGVFAQRYNAAGVPQGGEFPPFSNKARPAVAMDADGDFVLAGSGGGTGDDYGVFAQRYNAAGVPQGGEFRVNTTTTNVQFFPAVALNAVGDFVVAWDSQDDSNDLDIDAQRYNAAGVPQGGEFRVNTTTVGFELFPAVAMDTDGDFVVAWMSPDDGIDFGIYAQRYNAAGVAQGGEFRVNTLTTNGQRTPSIAMDADGDFVVAWTSYGQDGSGYGVYARRYNNAGVPQSGEFRVNTFTANDQTNPSVALDADGDFVVAWESYTQDGSYYGIYAQRYNAAGVPQGGEFRVNTFTTSSQSSPSVALDADGDFVVAWGSIQDGSFSGIYARRFEGPLKVFCGGLSASFVGTFNNDTLTGTVGNDVIAGLGGNDTLNGLGGNDFLCGGDGNDTLNGDLGTDTAVFGGLAGVNANLSTGIASGEGSDTLSGVENLIGSDGNDTLIGNAGNNLLIGRLGNDTLDGASGIDTAAFPGTIAVNANLNTGTATGQGSDTLANLENLIGSDGNDTLTGNTGNNSLDGAGGIDTTTFPSATAVNANLTTGTATGQGSDALTNLENLTGSSGNDTLTGNAGNNTLNGGLGNDSLDGAGGIDTAAFFGATAVNANLTTGTATGQGSDTLANLENLTGSNGNDTLTGNALNNTLNGGLGNDSLDGAGGVDTATFPGATAVTANLTTGTATGLGSDTLANIENLTGSSGNDTLTGSAGNNALNGGLGNDALDGAGGIDTAIFPGAIAINANLTSGAATGQGSDTLANLENLTGSIGNDTLTGNAGNNRLNGGSGNDMLNGAAGNDTLLGVAGDDVLDGDLGADTCDGGANGPGIDSAANCETVLNVP